MCLGLSMSVVKSSPSPPPPPHHAFPLRAHLQVFRLVTGSDSGTHLHTLTLVVSRESGILFLNCTVCLVPGW